MKTHGNARPGKPPVVEEETSPRYWAYVVGVNTRRVRLQLGWSMDVLAVELNKRGFEITASGLSLMERNTPTAFRPNAVENAPGHIRITVDRLMTLAAALGVHRDELLREDTL